VWITSQYVEELLCETQKNTNFALQIDESTDITNKAQLSAFVQFKTMVKSWKSFAVVKNCQKELKAKAFSTSCLLTWNPVVCNGASVLQFALMVRPQRSAE
jgi:hypothetical protein